MAISERTRKAQSRLEYELLRAVIGAKTLMLAQSDSPDEDQPWIFFHTEAIFTLEDTVHAFLEALHQDRSK